MRLYYLELDHFKSTLLEREYNHNIQIKEIDSIILLLLCSLHVIV